MLHTNYRKLLSVLIALFVVIAFVTPISGYTSVSAAQSAPQKKFTPVSLKPEPVAYRYDASAKAYHIDPPAHPKMALAATPVTIHYVPAGSVSKLGDTCMTFPESAKQAFNAAAQIWGNLLSSPVGITIQACWADLPTDVLGWSAATHFYVDSYGIIYPQALAHALNGSPLSTDDDISITYSNDFINKFYYGTDGFPPSNQTDFMSVVTHEIAHGLGFSGSMRVSGSTGQWGYSGSPLIYDLFAIDSQSNYLLDTGVYPNPSAALGSALTSAVYFSGDNAVAANGGYAVPLFTPSPWMQGSSYSHLDFNWYYGTPNTLMVYAIGPGSSIHDPGPVTLGILKDIGWTVNTVVQQPGVYGKSTPYNGAIGIPLTTTISWGTSSNADTYTYCYDTINNNYCDSSWSSPVTGNSATISGLTAGTTYYWEVRASNSAGTMDADGGYWWSFTTVPWPGVYGKSAPTNGATGVPFTTTISWGTSSNADSYTYCYDTINNNYCDSSWSSPIAGTSATISGLAGDTTYYWEVRASNSVGTMDADGGYWWSFTTVPNMPGAFSKATPNLGAGSVPLSTSLVWNPSAYATSYTYCYDTINNNTCDTGWQGPIAATSASISGLRASTTYYWQVRAANTAGTMDANAGGWWSFTTAAAAPSVISVGSAGTIPGGDVTVTVTASVASGAMMGASTVEITYDPAVFSVKGCTPDPDGRLSTKTCNATYAANKVRLNATSAAGVNGNVELASITFHALASSGLSTLTVTPVTFTDVNGPALATTPQNGMIIIANERMYLPFLTR